MDRKHEKYERLIARCKELPPTPTAVAHPCDESSLRGALEAAEMGILTPILVGPRGKIESVAQQFNLDISAYTLIDAEHSVAAAAAAVQLVREGKAEMLMKGSLHTDELMGAVVRSSTGLRTGRRISHAFIMDVPSLDRAIIVTDAAINIFPTLEDKKHIIQNAIDLSIALGFPKPYSFGHGDGQSRCSFNRGSCRPVQDGRPQADYRRSPGWSLGAGQRDRPQRCENQEDRLTGRRHGRHSDRPRPGSREHAGKKPDVHGRR